MKRCLLIFCVLCVVLIGNMAMAETDYSVYLDEEAVLFYKHCYDVALVHMDKETESDPEGYYKRYADEHQSLPEEIKEREKQSWMLFIWPDEQDLPRENAIVLSYAALEQLGGIERQVLSQYYTQAVLIDTDENRHVWRVWCMLAFDYFDSTAMQYEVFIDAKNGEIIRFEVHTADNRAG